MKHITTKLQLYCYVMSLLFLNSVFIPILIDAFSSGKGFIFNCGSS